MSRLRIAMLSEEAVNPEIVNEEVNDETSLEKDMLELEQSTNQTDAVEDSIDEAEQTQETLSKMEENPEEAVEIAKEHLMTRIGFANKVSLEKFNEVCDNSLTIAQEGLLQRFGHTLKLAVTSRAKMLSQTQEVLKKLKENGAKEGTIDEPGWGRVFTVNNSKHVKASEAIALVAKYQKLADDAGIIKAAKDGARILSDIGAALEKSTIIAKKSAVDEIHALYKQCQALAEENDKLSQHSQRIKYDVSFEPLQPADAEKIISNVEKMLDNNASRKAITDLYETVGEYNSTLISEHYQRLSSFFGFPADDIKAAKACIVELNKIFSNLAGIESDMNKLCYGAIQYVKASAK